ncbi:MAG: hypothetical protein ACTSWR_00165 [Candidatus Helarchaeota archaeon]
MINLAEFISKLKKILQIIELNPQSIIKFGSTHLNDLKKFSINKCIVSPDFNYNAISTLIEEKADLLLLFHTWSRPNIIDDLYQKLKFLRDKKVVILEIPKDFFSVPYGIHERIGSILNLEMVNVFHFNNQDSGRIFEPHQNNLNFNQLLDIIQTKFNLKYINYVSPYNNINFPVDKILVYLEDPPTENFIAQCYYQDINTLICSSIDFFKARFAEDYNINICILPYNWLNIILEQFVTHDLQIEIPEIKSIFVPSNEPIKFFSSK